MESLSFHLVPYGHVCGGSGGEEGKKRQGVLNVGFLFCLFLKIDSQWVLSNLSYFPYSFIDTAPDKSQGTCHRN